MLNPLAIFKLQYKKKTTRVKIQDKLISGRVRPASSMQRETLMDLACKHSFKVLLGAHWNPRGGVSIG